MGKLAVPEYILNKPGKLTVAEFEKMKLHASIGADILSAIDFPYPVVPIVRHHHENWDGSGYPTGIKGTDIPIGARILSVVDCFDALTSDRPYRQKLSDSDAISVLIERRGNMYDPLVVDTFLRVHDEIAPDSHISVPTRIALNEIASSTTNRELDTSHTRLEDVPAGVDESVALFELSQTLISQVNTHGTGDVVGKYLRRLIPFSLSVLYVYDDVRDELVAIHTLGAGSTMAKAIRIPLGQRLSGWVAVNRQTILNSDPMLDFGDSAEASEFRLGACLSTPLAT